MQNTFLAIVSNTLLGGFKLCAKILWFFVTADKSISISLFLFLSISVSLSLTFYLSISRSLSFELSLLLVWFQICIITINNILRRRAYSHSRLLFNFEITYEFAKKRV